jgi:Uma2 family endonuclease
MAVPVKKNNDLFTYADYLTWPDEERWELIDGIPYDMTPAPNRYHQDISVKMTSTIEQFLRSKKCKVYAAPFDVRFQEVNQNDDEILTVVQPDISVICDRSKLDEKGCKGAPDLIIEILSLGTSRKDRVIKFYTYERFGVKEYWIISPDDKTVEVFILGENGKYGRPEFYTEKKVLPCYTLQGLNINPAEIFIED